MNRKFNVETIINFNHTPLLLSVYMMIHGDFLNKLYIWSTFSNIKYRTCYAFSWSPFGRWSAMNSFSIFKKKEFARTLKKKHFHYLLFFYLSLHQTTTGFLGFIKGTIHAFVISITSAFSVNWVANFSGWANLIGFFKFHKAHFL